MIVKPNITLTHSSVRHASSLLLACATLWNASVAAAETVQRRLGVEQPATVAPAVRKSQKLTISKPPPDKKGTGDLRANQPGGGAKPTDLPQGPRYQLTPRSDTTPAEPDQGGDTDRNDYEDRPYDYSGSYDYQYYGNYGGEYYQAPGSRGSMQPSRQRPGFKGFQGNLMEQSRFELSAPVKPRQDKPSSGESQDEDPSVEPGIVTILNRDMDQAKALAQRAGELGYPVKRRRRLYIGGVLSTLRVPRGQAVAKALQKLRGVFPDFVIDASTRYRPMGTDRHYAANLVNWNQGSRHCGTNRKIALLDTPVDTQHPALRNAHITSISMLPGGNTPPAADHGTAIATLLVGDPSSDHPGLLPGAALTAINVYRQLDKKTVNTTSELVIQALDQAMRSGVDAINLSLGGPPNALLDVVLRTILSKQVFVVAAAGNNGPSSPPVYPAAYRGVLAVTAVDARAKIYDRANQGGYIEFAAPGVDVWGGAGGAQSRYHTGTSFAAPFVTVAVVALRTAHPDGPARVLYKKMADNAKDLGEPGRDPVFGWGLLQNQLQCPQVASGG